MQLTKIFSFVGLLGGAALAQTQPLNVHPSPLKATISACPQAVSCPVTLYRNLYK